MVCKKFLAACILALGSGAVIAQSAAIGQSSGIAQSAVIAHSSGIAQSAAIGQSSGIAQSAVIAQPAVIAQSADTLTVHFDFNQSTLRAEDRTALDSRFDPPGPRIIAIELAGYCDIVGTDRYNDTLALHRISAVMRYLQAKGFADSLFKVRIAYGRRNPLNDNGDADRRSLNRRVTLSWRRAPLSPLRKALQDTAAVVGKTVLLNVLFYGDLHRPLPASLPVLQDLLSIMREHPGLRIEIQGHVCCMPPELDGRDFETHHYDLSTQRAKFVYGYLADHGIDTSRMSYRGFGASHKIFPRETDQTQMTMNRRVEIKILRW